MSSLPLSGFVVLDGLLGAAQADQRCAESRVTAAGVLFGLFAFLLTAGQFIAQRLQRLVHDASVCHRLCGF